MRATQSRSGAPKGWVGSGDRGSREPDMGNDDTRPGVVRKGGRSPAWRGSRHGRATDNFGFRMWDVRGAVLLLPRGAGVGRGRWLLQVPQLAPSSVLIGLGWVGILLAFQP